MNMELSESPVGEQLALGFDAPRRNATARFIDFLRSEPTPVEVAQELVLGYLADHQARACLISIIEADATLRLVGGFGLDDGQMMKLGNGSLWGDVPPASAIRQRRILVTTSSEQLVAQFPVMGATRGDGHGLVAVPLMTSASTVGALCVCFESDGSRIELAAQTLSAIADVYVLYLLSNHPVPPAPDRRRSGEERAPRPRPSSLTSRQLAILRLLGQGMTYDQIASRIGYSHSTVRMELMQSYRLLGVSSRREAVRVAGERGLIDDEVDAVALR